jgi:hypothetical protein
MKIEKMKKKDKKGGLGRSHRPPYLVETVSL